MKRQEMMMFTLGHSKQVDGPRAYVPRPAPEAAARESAFHRVNPDLAGSRLGSSASILPAARGGPSELSPRLPLDMVRQSTGSSAPRLLRGMAGLDPRLASSLQQPADLRVVNPAAVAGPSLATDLRAVHRGHPLDLGPPARAGLLEDAAHRARAEDAHRARVEDAAHRARVEDSALRARVEDSALRARVEDSALRARVEDSAHRARVEDAAHRARVEEAHRAARGGGDSNRLYTPPEQVLS